MEFGSEGSSMLFLPLLVVAEMETVLFLAISSPCSLDGPVYCLDIN